jgi:hypothetical protein
MDESKIAGFIMLLLGSFAAALEFGRWFAQN